MAKNYGLMRVASLKIKMQKYKLLLNETKILLEKNFSENTKTLLREMKKLEEATLKNDKVDSKSMYELSRIITY